MFAVILNMYNLNKTFDNNLNSVIITLGDLCHSFALPWFVRMLSKWMHLLADWLNVHFVMSGYQQGAQRRWVPVCTAQPCLCFAMVCVGFTATFLQGPALLLRLFRHPYWHAAIHTPKHAVDFADLP